VPQPAPANEAFSKLPRLKLVTEKPLSERPEASKARKTAMREPVEAARCVSYGPFGDLTTAARAASTLRGKGFDPRQRGVEGATSDGFWVYIGGLASEPDTTRVLRKLEQNGIKDAHAMPETDEGRRISVGIFTERERADRRAQAVRKMGLKAEMGERKLPGTVYWVDVSLSTGVVTVPTKDLSAEGATSRVGVQPCPAGAGVQPASSPADPVAPEPGPSGSRAPPTTVAAAPKLP
jgi:hypothetical protein